MITGKQCRAARALLNMTQNELAEAVKNPARSAILTFEAEEKASKHTIDTLSNYFGSQGIEFLPNDGVSFKPDTKVYKGTEGFRLFMDDVFEVVSTVGGQIRLHNAKPDNWIKWLGADWYAMHRERMKPFQKNIEFRVTAVMGETNFIGNTHSEYRWLPEEMFTQQSFYVYGDRLALMSFSEEDVEIYVVRKEEFAESFRALFDVTWEERTVLPDVGNYKPEE